MRSHEYANDTAVGSVKPERLSSGSDQPSASELASTPTMKSTLAEIAPEFERQTGHRLATTFDNAAALKRRIDVRETFYVAIPLPDQIDQLIR